MPEKHARPPHRTLAFEKITNAQQELNKNYQKERGQALIVYNSTLGNQTCLETSLVAEPNKMFCFVWRFNEGSPKQHRGSD